MKQLLIASATLFMITACTSVGVIESNDPKEKIKSGYQVLQGGRSLPAKRLFEEASVIAQQGTDESLKAEALVGLGDVYKYKDGGAQTGKTYDIKKSLSSYEQAAKILEKLKYNQRLSMVYLGLSQANMQTDEASKACDYMIKAAKTFYEPSGGEQDKLNEKIRSHLASSFGALKAQDYKVSCEVHDPKKDGAQKVEPKKKETKSKK